MTIFDALFLLCFFAAVVALIWAAVVALRGKDAQALMKLRTLGMSAAAYMTVVLVVALVIPRKVYSIGDMQCFDDWCITVVSTAHISDSVVVDLRLSRRAKRVPQGEKGTVVYLVDRQGRRYNPTSDREDIPFDTPLQPGESLITTRRFTVPSGVGALGLIYTHEGGFPIGSFVIGENDWFHGPPDHGREDYWRSYDPKNRLSCAKIESAPEMTESAAGRLQDVQPFHPAFQTPPKPAHHRR